MSTIALVTGGNRGIGREVCRQLAARGHTVILTARSLEDAAGAARPTRARQAGSSATASHCPGDIRRTTNGDVTDLSTPLSHAALIVQRIQEP